MMFYVQSMHERDYCIVNTASLQGKTMSHVHNIVWQRKIVMIGFKANKHVIIASEQTNSHPSGVHCIRQSKLPIVFEVIPNGRQ